MIELFQLTPVPARLAEVHRGFALVFGTTFHWPDLPAYVIGCAVTAGVDAWIRSASSSRGGADGLEG